jgi:hypothetical protein
VAVTSGMNGGTLREPVNARGHRVLAHLCAEFQRALVTGGIDEANARDCVAVMLRRAHLAAAKDAEDESAAERDTAALLERVLAQ